MRRWTISTAALLAGFILCWGCSGGANNTDAAGGDGAGATDSAGDVQRSDVAATDMLKELVQEPQLECLSHSDCEGDSRVCNCFGKWVDAGFKECEADKNCGGGSFCDPCVGMCYAIRTLCEPCTSEHICNPMSGACMPTGNQCDVDGSHCLDFVSGGSFCGRACLSDAGCPGGYRCEDLSAFGLEYSQCLPMTGNCDGLGGCEDDMECEFKYICNPDGVCVKGCEEDTECPNSMVCSAFRCTEACDPVNNPCPEGQQCIDGRCMIPGGCVDAFDCPEPETYCNMTAHMCEDGCEADFDCKSAGKICEFGTCVAKGCTANYWCSFGQVCEIETGECVEPPEPFCEPGCEEDVECGPEGSKCLQLQDEDGNDMGKFCFPICYTDPENLCPQGYQCMELVDQDGASQGKVCARACYEEPVGFY